MADLTLGGAAVLRATIARPRVGVWHADLTLDTATLPTGRVTLASADGALSMVGTVARASVWQARAEVRVTGGAGGLGTVLAPRFYRNATVSVVLRDVLRECGESLSETIDAALLGGALATWTRDRARGGDVIARLAAASDCVWRVLPDGTVWLGRETWPNVEVPGDVIEDSARELEATVATDTTYALLAPGTTWLGKRVSYVEHRLADASATTRVLFEADASATRPRETDRARQGIDRIVQDAVRRTLHHALYPAQVLSQAADRSVTVQLDGDLFPALTDVPIRHAAPGEASLVAQGARCLVGFEGGDPRAPYVALFTQDAGKQTRWTVEAANIRLGTNAERGIVRKDDLTRNGSWNWSVVNNPGPTPPQSSDITLTWTPPAGVPGAAQSISLRVTGAVSTAVTSVTPITEAGAADTASGKAHAE